MKRMYSAALPAIFAFVASMACCTIQSPLQAESNAIAWTEDFESAVQRANATNKPLLLHFYGDYCPPCKLLDKKTFHDPKLISAINTGFVAVKINADKRPDLKDHYQITRWPTDLYVLPNGDELFRTISPQDPAVYTQIVERNALRHRDWTVEQNALAKAREREQDRKLASRGPQGDPSRSKGTSGSEGRSVTTHSAQFAPAAPKEIAQTPPALPSDTRSTNGQRVIENPYIAQAEVVARPNLRNPVVVYPADNATPNTSLVANNNPSITNNHSANNTQPNTPPRTVTGVPPNLSPKVSLAMSGYCPVQLRKRNDWIEGSPSYAVRHRGRIYYCFDEASRQTLLKDPDLYTPALSGYDIVHFAKTGELVEGKCEFGCNQESTNRFFFFVNEENLDQFERDCNSYSQLIDSQQRERVADRPIAGSRH